MMCNTPKKGVQVVGVFLVLWLPVVEKAAKSGGVTKIKMVSRETNNFLGIVGKYTTIVQGD
ncbi:hypothetical protein VN1250_11650 [Helicobacter pylori]|nr:hypothetical protein VN1250_11650 [Helicobacter pylori]